VCIEKSIYKNCDDLADILIHKNNMYGSSFSKTLDKYGFSIVLARLEDKFSRLEHLLEKYKTIFIDKKPENTKNWNFELEEKIKDTLLDLAGYSLLFKTYLDNKKPDNNTSTRIIDCSGD